MNTANLLDPSIEETKSLSSQTQGETLFIALHTNSSYTSKALINAIDTKHSAITEVITTTDKADDIIFYTALENDIRCVRVSRKYEDNILRIVSHSVDQIIIEEPLTESGVFNHIKGWMNKGIFKHSLLLPVSI